MKSPLISIIVPVYNTERYLPECLDSILSQSFSDYEIICINDGSTDNSLETLKIYKQKDCRISVYNQENGGLSAARNTGLDQMSGKFVFFIDSDDQMLPGALEKLVSCITEKTDGIISGCAIEYQAHSEMKHSDDLYYTIPYEGSYFVDDELLNSIHVSAWGKLYRTDIIRKYNLKFPEGKNHEDFYWHWCYFSVAKQITLTKSRTVKYFRRPGSIMSQVFEKKSAKAIDHLLIMDDICHFLSKNKILEKKRIIPKLFEASYWFSIQHSPEYESAKILGILISLLQKWKIDCSDHWYLQDVIMGNYEIIVGDVARKKQHDIAFNIKQYLKEEINKIFNINK